MRPQSKCCLKNPNACKIVKLHLIKKINNNKFTINIGVGFWSTQSVTSQFVKL